jgi:hypothetical protein
MAVSGDTIGDEAEKRAGYESKENSLKYVVNAVQRAKGETESDIDIESAKDSAPFFLKQGY